MTPTISGDTGVARYAQQLVEQLTSRHHDLELRAFAIGRGGRAPLPVRRRVRAPLRAVHTSWGVAHLPRAEHFVGRVDLVHALDMIPPPSRAPVVVTVHDVLPLTLPDLYGARYVTIARRQAAQLRRAAVVLTTCESTADEIARVTGVARERIAVTPLGARRTAPTAGAPTVAGDYLLYVGAITPRKGLQWLVGALELLPDAPPLVVVGPNGWRAEEVLAAIEGSSARDRVRLLGRVSDDELDRLVAGATILCHPSEAEGFGMPCLEALALGAPVVAADIPSIRELAGDAARFVPPRDPPALAEALGALLADDGARAELAARGPRRAAGYTWETTADLTAAVYRRVLQR